MTFYSGQIPAGQQPVGRFSLQLELHPNRYGAGAVQAEVRIGQLAAGQLGSGQNRKSCLRVDSGQLPVASSLPLHLVLVKQSRPASPSCEPPSQSKIVPVTKLPASELK